MFNNALFLSKFSLDDSCFILRWGCFVSGWLQTNIMLEGDRWLICPYRGWNCFGGVWITRWTVAFTRCATWRHTWARVWRIEILVLQWIWLRPGKSWGWSIAKFSLPLRPTILERKTWLELKHGSRAFDMWILTNLFKFSKTTTTLICDCRHFYISIMLFLL